MTKISSIYNLKIVTKLSEMLVQDPKNAYPGSGSREQNAPDPVSDPQHCIFMCKNLFSSITGVIHVGLDLGPDPDPAV